MYTLFFKDFNNLNDLIKLCKSKTITKELYKFI